MYLITYIKLARNKSVHFSRCYSTASSTPLNALVLGCPFQPKVAVVSDVVAAEIFSEAKVNHCVQHNNTVQCQIWISTSKLESSNVK